VSDLRSGGLGCRWQFSTFDRASAALGFIKKLLLEHELNVTRVSQEGEYRTPKSDGSNFSFAFFFL
jgi:hypothetical protein